MRIKLDSRRITSIIGAGSAVLILLFGWRVLLTSKNVAAENALLRRAIGTPLVLRQATPHLEGPSGITGTTEGCRDLADFARGSRCLRGFDADVVCGRAFV